MSVNPNMARRTIEKTVVGSIALSVIVTLSHLIPFNIPVLLLFLPLTAVFPQLAQSGAEVTYGFAWLQIHAFWVWIVIFVWHLILLSPLVYLFFRWRSNRKRE